MEILNLKRVSTVLSICTGRPCVMAPDPGLSHVLYELSPSIIMRPAKKKIIKNRGDLVSSPWKQVTFEVL